jgi:N-acetylneuraminic acid mutarotase
MCRVTTAALDSATCAVPAIAQCDTIRPLLETTTNKWIAKASFPGLGRSGAVSFTILNKGYVGLGASNLSTFPVSHKDIWEYNPDNNSWTQKADYQGQGKYLTSSFSLRSSAYVCGGYDFVNGIAQAPQSDFYSFSPTNNSWNAKEFLPVPNAGGAGFSDGYDLGYIVCPNNTNLTYEFQLSAGTTGNGTWTQKAIFPGGNTLRPMSFNIGKRYFVGNSNGSFWEYNNTAGTWTQRPAAPAGNSAVSSSFSIGDTAYRAS